jgi:hypothetical protein
MILAFETNPPKPPLRKGGGGISPGVTAKLNSIGVRGGEENGRVR